MHLYTAFKALTVLALSASVLGAPASQHGNSIAPAGSGSTQTAAAAVSPPPGSENRAEACVRCKDVQHPEARADEPKKLSAWTKFCYNCRYQVLDKNLYMTYNTDKPKDKAYMDWRKEKVKGKSWDGISSKRGPIYTTHGRTCCGRSVVLGDDSSIGAGRQ
ncbi:uncharacterized protein PpBr36_10563 [Pyricularia pennisetigena]|uniref:uncharacterized protein n=1 Tax=Pyricularia pennisetigena TaxID=1578925 RepID=UPI00114FD787|nr:uncharacterized protein PpBr36_10563 [Pyricularia pennisetigena]TLS21109.1 hypothetical protein PpBr36_10563 [Pyricularia pennisetigena]